MPKLRFYRAYSRVPLFGYAGKAVALAALAAAFPLAGLAAFTFAPDAIATPVAAEVLLGGVAALSFMLLAALASYLSAVKAAAEEMRACAALAAGADTGPRPRDELVAMLEDMRQISAKFDSVRHRLANRHPVTGVA